MSGIITASEIAQLVVEKLTEKGVLVPRLLTLEMAASYMGMTREALRAKAVTNQIPRVRIDSRFRFDREDLDRLIEASKGGFFDENSGPRKPSILNRRTEHRIPPAAPKNPGKRHRTGAHKTREQKWQEMLEKAGSENPD